MIIFALDKEEKRVHVDSVPRGYDCNCICPGCKERVYSTQGLKQIHVFRHINDTYVKSSCKYTDSQETLQHYLAKTIIAGEKR